MYSGTLKMLLRKLQVVLNSCAGPLRGGTFPWFPEKKQTRGCRHRNRSFTADMSDESDILLRVMSISQRKGL